MTPWGMAMLGGVMIGLSAVLLLLFNGRIAGVSGIVNGIGGLSRAGDRAWRVAFLVGLMAAGALAMRYLGASTPSPAGTPLLLIAGLLVGFGTSLGNGCTSGHGVCGLGRLSKRSLLAVLTFMVTAIITVYVMRHIVQVPA